MLVSKPAPYLTFFGRRKIIPAKPPSQSEYRTLEDDLEEREAHRREGEALGHQFDNLTRAVKLPFGRR